MARRSFTEVPYIYGDSKYGVAVGQTRNGVEELVTLAGSMVWDGAASLWVPVSAAKPLPVGGSPDGSAAVALKTTAAGEVITQLSGRNPTRRVITTAPLAAGAWYDRDPIVDLTVVSPHFSYLGYVVRSDTVVTLAFDSGSGTSLLSTVGQIAVKSASTFYPVVVPRFLPLGSRFQVRVQNPTGTNQTLLEVEEIRYPDWVSHTQNLKAWLINDAPASIFTDTTTTHTFSRDPTYFYRLVRILWGGGKLPIYVVSSLDQGVDLGIRVGTKDPTITPVLGTKSIPAGATVIITNADFPGIDVPSENIDLTAKAQVVPTTGTLVALTDTLVGGV